MKDVCMSEQAVEEKWRRRWAEEKLFLFDEKSDKPMYIIDTPPPFTNGALHMGQIFWISYIDSIARYKRMCGFNVLYPQGWDAHGFLRRLQLKRSTERGLAGKNSTSGAWRNQWQTSKQ